MQDNPVDKLKGLNDIEYELSDIQKNNFEKDGFLIIDSIITKNDDINTLKSRISPLFHGDFQTKIFPDEWHWRPGLSKDDITREIVNAWKSDKTIAKLVLSEKFGKLAADLMGWNSARVAQDDIFWKPVSGKPIGFHQDAPYMNFFTPNQQVVTVWIALTDVSLENGTLEYAKSSHLWDKARSSDITNQFHAPSNYKFNLEEAAKLQGINKDDLQIIPVQVKAGGCSVHHGFTFHGSNHNPSNFKERISIAIHYIPGESEFKDDTIPGNEIGYIYGRYKIENSLKLEESFFPITYSKSGYKSSCIKKFIN